VAGVAEGIDQLEFDRCNLSQPSCFEDAKVAVAAWKGSDLGWPSNRLYQYWLPEPCFQGSPAKGLGDP